MLIVALILEMLLLATWARRRLASPPDGALRRYLRGVEERSRSGQGGAWRDEAVAGVVLDVQNLLRQVERRGISLLPGIHALQKELRANERHAEICRRLWWIVYARAVLVVGFALAFRLYLERQGSGGIQVMDAVAVAAAGVLLAIGQAIVVRSLPRSWSGDPAPSALAIAWTQDVLHAGASTQRPWSDGVRVLERRQMRIGVSCTREIRDVLFDWARCQSTEGRQRVKRLEETLPLLELTTIGIPAALLLVVPMLAVLS